MINKLLPFTILFFLISCGFQPINKTIKNDFSFSNIDVSGEKISSQSFKNLLSKYEKSKLENQKNYKIKIFSSVNKSTTAKNSAGESTSFKLEVIAKTVIFDDNTKIINNDYSESINYNNKSSKSELKQYENILKKDLVREIVFNIINDLTLVK